MRLRETLRAASKAMASKSWCVTPDRELHLMICHTSSKLDSAPETGVPDLDLPSAIVFSSSMAARSRSRAARVTAQLSGSACPVMERHQMDISPNICLRAYQTIHQKMRRNSCLRPPQNSEPKPEPRYEAPSHRR